MHVSQRMELERQRLLMISSASMTSSHELLEFNSNADSSCGVSLSFPFLRILRILTVEPGYDSSLKRLVLVKTSQD